jgi:hypothetical protein
MFMVSSKKTACVSVSMMTREAIARTPPPAFLFPINDVKDPASDPADPPV